MATDDIKQIIDATDIVALVSSYNIKLDKQGKNYKGLCPFHHEDTPSFLVSPEKKLAHCFGCGGGGDPIKFIMQIENIDFQDAIVKLAEFNGIEYKSNYHKKENPNKKYYDIVKMAINFYRANYEKTEYGLEARDYLLKRGLTDEVIKDFNIGLAPKQRDSLYEVLRDSNFLELDMVDSGLINNENGYHDFFIGRIMFPIYDEQGNPIGFSARIFDNKDKNQPKYINSKESMIYHKSEVLFNFQNAKGEIMKMKRVILHEGQMDVIASYKSGMKEAICTMGTALSITQARILYKYTNNAIICYDGDKAGIKASLKAIKIFKQVGFNVRLVLLPDGMDPDEYVLKYGIDKYKDYFESNLIDEIEYQYLVTIMNKDFSDNIVFKEVCNQIFNLLFAERSESIKESYLKRLAKDTNTSYDAIRFDYNSFIGNQNVNVDFIDDYEPNEIVPETIKEVWNSIAELRLFIYAKGSKATAIYIDQTLGDDLNGFKPKTANLWTKLVYEYYMNFDKFDEGLFVKMLSAEEACYYTEMMEAVSKSNIEPYNQEDIQNCISKIKLLSCDAKNEELKRKISSNNTSKEKQFEYANDVFQNKKKKLQMSKKK